MASGASKALRLPRGSKKFAMKAARYTLFSQLSFFGFMFVCFLLNPHFLLKSNEGGVSNYGIYARTVIPYTLALGLCGLFLLLAARFVPTSTSARKNLKWVLVFLGILYLLELVSTYPYKLNNTLDNIHIYTGVVLFTAATVIGCWFGLFFAKNKTNILILAVQLLGFTLAGLTFFGYLHILFIAEQLTSLAFGVLLVRTVAATA